MISKKELQSVYYLSKEIELREKRKRELGYGLKRLQIDEELKALDEEIDIAYRRIIDMIHKITDVRLKQIVTLRCIYLLSWQEIANATGGTADSERMYYKRAFDEQGYIKLVYFE